MRLLLLICAAYLSGVSWTLAANPSENDAQPDGRREVCLASLPKATRDQIAWLQPGRKRAEIEKRFEQDGGLTALFVERYSPRADYADTRGFKKVVMLELAFQPKKMPDAVFADPDRKHAWGRRHSGFPRPDDVLRGIGKPFLAHPSQD